MRKDKGFTLIELMIVIAIIAIIESHALADRSERVQLGELHRSAA
jgi:prepilin-type N-terminal cleavage/methylation domain-containing protein